MCGSFGNVSMLSCGLEGILKIDCKMGYKLLLCQAHGSNCKSRCNGFSCTVGTFEQRVSCMLFFSCLC